MTHRMTHPALVVLTVLALASPASAVERELFDLLLASSYHGYEITADDGDVYLAVVRDGDGWKTVAAAIRVVGVEDPIRDAPGEMTGKEVSVEGAEPLFLVRGDLAPGPVETLEWQPQTLSGSPSFAWTLANGERYQLSVNCPGPAEPSEEARARGEFPAAWGELCALRLSHGPSVQELAELPVNRFHEPRASLLWAGDLDRDGQLDLLLDLSDHYNKSQPTLFLSSAASDRDIVAPVAHLVRIGC